MYIPETEGQRDERLARREIQIQIEMAEQHFKRAADALKEGAEKALCRDTRLHNKLRDASAAVEGLLPMLRDLR